MGVHIFQDYGSSFKTTRKVEKNDVNNVIFII